MSHARSWKKMGLKRNPENGIVTRERPPGSIGSVRIEYTPGGKPAGGQVTNKRFLAASNVDAKESPFTNISTAIDYLVMMADSGAEQPLRQGNDASLPGAMGAMQFSSQAVLSILIVVCTSSDLFGTLRRHRRHFRDG